MMSTSKHKTDVCHVLNRTILLRVLLPLLLLLPQLLYIQHYSLRVIIEDRDEGTFVVLPLHKLKQGKRNVTTRRSKEYVEPAVTLLPLVMGATNVSIMNSSEAISPPQTEIGNTALKTVVKGSNAVNVKRKQAPRKTNKYAMAAKHTANGQKVISATPKKYGWATVSPQEVDVYPTPCKHPWKHCCIGQGRVLSDRKRKMYQLYQKWSDPSLQGIDKVLEFVANDKDKGNKSDDTCNLWFIGDSTTSDHIVAAMCDLSRHGYAMVECVQALGDPANYKDDVRNCFPANLPLSNKSAVNLVNETTHGSSIYPFPNFVMRRQAEQNWNDIPVQLKEYNIQGCSEVVLRFTDFTNTISNATRIADLLDDRNKLSRQFIDRGGAIMFNFGLHCNDNQCIENLMRNSFYPFYRWIKSEAVSGDNSNKWKLVWKETEPQHFNTDGGHFHVSGYRPRKPCLMEKKYRTKPLNNFRNIKTRAMMKELNLTEIPFIELFDKLTPRYDFHSDRSGDCTHYIYTPWRFDISWDGWLKGLMRLSAHA